MRSIPSDPLGRHSRFISALCADWLEAGTVTSDTPRADAVLEICKQSPQEAGRSNASRETR